MPCPSRGPPLRTVNAFLGIAALAQLDEATDRLIFGPLHDAEAKADLRSARRSSGKGADSGATPDAASAAD